MTPGLGGFIPEGLESANAKRALVADLVAGAAATTVILPQAMAFGVALLGPHGFGAAAGAIVGLIGAASVSLMSGLVGGTRGLISAPTGPTLVLLAGALSALAKTGAAGTDLLVGLALVLVTTGVFQILIGLSGGGRLIKFIPYSVIVGFMTGSGVLMIMSQQSPLSGAEIDNPWDVWRWMPAATAAFTFAVMWWFPRVTTRIPNTIAGLIGGSACFHLVTWLTPRETPATWVIGALPGPDSMEFALLEAAPLDQPWLVILASSLALAVLASVDTLLTALVADVDTGARHSARRELVGQGLGQIVSGLFGGMAGAGTTGATLVSTKTGGRRWVGAMAGVVFGIIVVVGRPLGLVLPVSVLGGIILFVAVRMLDRDIWAWAKRRRTRADAGIAIVVATVTVAYDLIVAVGVGVAIAIVIFIRAQLQAPVIHRRSTGAQRTSLRKRSQAHRDLLEAHGERIVLYELRGNLFFATADRLFNELADDLARPAWVILDLRRVQRVDLTGVKIIEQMAAKLRASGGQLCFCEVHREIGLGKKVKKTLRKVNPDVAAEDVKTFNGADEALEYAENRLLTELGETLDRPDGTVELADSDLCLHMSSEQVGILDAAMRNSTFKAGEQLFARLSPGQELYVVRKGQIEIRMPTTRHHHTRLATHGPGTVFGEVAFLAPGPRSAAAVAVSDCEVRVLDQTGFRLLRDKQPEAALAVLTGLARAQSKLLRWTASEVHRLSQW